MSKGRNYDGRVGVLWEEGLGMGMRGKRTKNKKYIKSKVIVTEPDFHTAPTPVPAPVSVLYTSPPQGFSPPQQASYFYTQQGGQRGARRENDGPLRKDRCYQCGRNGHFARECPTGEGLRGKKKKEMITGKES